MSHLLDRLLRLLQNNANSAFFHDLRGIEVTHSMLAIGAVSQKTYVNNLLISIS